MEVELSTDETVRALRVQTLLWAEVEILITAQCHVCKRDIEVPSTWAATYVMLHRLPCRKCEFGDAE